MQVRQRRSEDQRRVFLDYTTPGEILRRLSTGGSTKSNVLRFPSEYWTWANSTRRSNVLVPLTIVAREFSLAVSGATPVTTRLAACGTTFLNTFLELSHPSPCSTKRFMPHSVRRLHRSNDSEPCIFIVFPMNGDNTSEVQKTPSNVTSCTKLRDGLPQTGPNICPQRLEGNYTLKYLKRRS